jgi:hypothetical protein
MWQSIVVGVAVGVATLYVAWTLLPSVLRLRLATRFAERARRPGWLVRLASRVEGRARAGAGVCSDCGASTPPPSRSGRARR